MPWHLTPDEDNENTNKIKRDQQDKGADLYVSSIIGILEKNGQAAGRGRNEFKMHAIKTSLLAILA